jgi:hypothetical protein
LNRAVRGRALMIVAAGVTVGVLATAASVPGAAASSKPAWSLRFTGGVSGTAKAFRTAGCTQQEPSGNQLAPIASFKVAKKSYQIQIRFDPPVQAGTRPFGASASPTTVSINLIAAGGPSWTTGTGNGTATVHSDVKSGSVDGQLVAAGSTGKPVTVRGKFACASFTP